MHHGKNMFSFLFSLWRVYLGETRFPFLSFVQESTLIHSDQTNEGKLV